MNRQTRDQIAAVMLLHGTPAQRRDALEYCSTPHKEPVMTSPDPQMDILHMRVVRTIAVRVEPRSDGGVRVWSPEVPGLILAGPDRDAVLRDLPSAVTQLCGGTAEVHVTVAAAPTTPPATPDAALDRAAMEFASSMRSPDDVGWNWWAGYCNGDELAVQQARAYRDTLDGFARAAAPDPTAPVKVCPDCGRPKARSAHDAGAGMCPKWWAITDKDADADCARHTTPPPPTGEVKTDEPVAWAAWNGESWEEVAFDEGTVRYRNEPKRVVFALYTHPADREALRAEIEQLTRELTNLREDIRQDSKLIGGHIAQTLAERADTAERERDGEKGTAPIETESYAVSIYTTREGAIISNRSTDSGDYRTVEGQRLYLHPADHEALRAENERLTRERDGESFSEVSELLAVIHRDGGHYEANHGYQKALSDAEKVVIELRTRLADAERRIATVAKVLDKSETAMSGAKALLLASNKTSVVPYLTAAIKAITDFRADEVAQSSDLGGTGS